MRASYSQKSKSLFLSTWPAQEAAQGASSFLWLQLHEEPAEKCSCNRYQCCLLFGGEPQRLGEHNRSSVLCSLTLPVPLLPAQVKHSHRWMLILWKGNRQDSNLKNIVLLHYNFISALYFFEQER